MIALLSFGPNEYDLLEETDDTAYIEAISTYLENHGDPNIAFQYQPGILFRIIAYDMITDDRVNLLRDYFKRGGVVHSVDVYNSVLDYAVVYFLGMVAYSCTSESIAASQVLTIMNRSIESLNSLFREYKVQELECSEVELIRPTDESLRQFYEISFNCDFPNSRFYQSEPNNYIVGYGSNNDQETSPDVYLTEPELRVFPEYQNLQLIRVLLENGATIGQDRQVSVDFSVAPKFMGVNVDLLARSWLEISANISCI